MNVNLEVKENGELQEALENLKKKEQEFRDAAYRISKFGVEVKITLNDTYNYTKK